MNPKNNGHSRREASRLTRGEYTEAGLRRLDERGVLIPENAPRYTPEEVEHLQTLADIKKAGVSFQRFLSLARWVLHSELHRSTGIPIEEIRRIRSWAEILRAAGKKEGPK